MAEKSKSGGCGYAGRISNAGAQRVEAPFAAKAKQTGRVKRGDDLRTGKARNKRAGRCRPAAAKSQPKSVKIGKGI